MTIFPRIITGNPIRFMELSSVAQVVPAVDPEGAGELSGLFFTFDGPPLLPGGNPLVAFMKMKPIGYTYPGDEDEDLPTWDPPSDPPSEPCPVDDNDDDGVPNDVNDNKEVDDGDDACPDQPGYGGRFTDPGGNPLNLDPIPPPVTNGCPRSDVSAPKTACPAARSLSFTLPTPELGITFFVGPVPFNLEAGVTGSIGFELYANIQPIGLAAKAGPFAELEATITGAIGIKIPGPVSAEL